MNNSIGGVNPQQSSIAAHQQEAKADVKEAAQGMREVMSDIKELSQELRNQQSFKTSGKETNSKLETKTNQTLDQLQEQSQAQQKQVAGQEQSQQAQLSQGKDAEQVAAAMAGLMEEEALGEDNEIQMALEEKLELLMKEAENLDGVELENPDDNDELQQMFTNLGKLKQLKKREQQVNKQLEDAEITLKEQETREELNKLPVDETTKKMREQLSIQQEGPPLDGAVNDETTDIAEDSKDEQQDASDDNTEEAPQDDNAEDSKDRSSDDDANKDQE